MGYSVLASDYDGTLAEDGVVSTATLGALEKFRRSGRRLVLVTGRELQDLESVFSRLDLFDCIVAENGAVLYWPIRCEKRMLADPPNTVFINTLRQRGVQPLSAGDAIVSTGRPYESAVLGAIRDLGLDLCVVPNKDSLMVLPAGVDKSSGLRAALDSLGLSEQSVVGVGDAENDHAFLDRCQFSAAVANALPEVKETADLTTRGAYGAGVEELIEMILDGGLRPKA